MKIAFFTEMEFQGKIPRNHPNMRVEFAWMCALEADHYNIKSPLLEKYDLGIVIIPKKNPDFNIDDLKLNCKKVAVMQEGPNWYWQDYDLSKQIWYYNTLTSSDIIFTHNEIDKKYYQGLTDHHDVRVLQSLMIEDAIGEVQNVERKGVIIGGNFARWYGGMESFTVAQRIQVPIWGQTSHAMREGEDQLVNHLPRVMWTDWMKQLGSFKYAVHLMPTIAAGTFSLNCAYLGIPCIGNEKVDTQRLCHPELSVDVEDLEKAAMLAERLRDDKEFYEECSKTAKENYKKYYNQELFKLKINTILNI
jgi:hypothetical protein